MGFWQSHISAHYEWVVAFNIWRNEFSELTRSCPKVYVYMVESRNAQKWQLETKYSSIHSSLMS